jgi:hypothetical protein
MLIFRRYFGSEVKGIKVRTVIKIRDLCQQSPRMNANEIQKSKKKLPFAENQAISEKMEM